MGVLRKYRLKKDLPQLKAGAIFEHRDYDDKFPDRGNIGSGVMILAWINGKGQDNWFGETFIMPGQLASNRDWFEPIKNTDKDQILAEIEALKERVSKL